jgi:hypothetical protein
LRSPTRLVLALVAGLLTAAPVAAFASSPSIATLDADARASGNRKLEAERIGEQIFAIEWPAQVMKVSANSVDDSLVVGLKVSGVKFHGPLTRTAFESEAITLIGMVLAAEPKVTEVDLWAAVPLTVGKGVIVSGDLATPTTRNVFTVSSRRGESAAALAARVKALRGIYLDEEWARTTLKGVNR